MAAMELQQVVDDELSRYSGPVLIFDRERIRANLIGLGKAFGGNPGGMLFAVKSFSHAEILQTVWETGVGFEVSNEREYRLLPRDLSLRTVSLNSPLREDPAEFVECGNRLHVHLESVPDRTIIGAPSDGSYCLRLDHKSLPLDSSLLVERDRPSRFGVSWSSFLESAPLFREGILSGVHVHNGSEVNTAAFYRAALKLLLDSCEENQIPLRYVNLGGGLHPIAQAELEKLLGDLHSTAGELPIFIEPGHVICREAGFLLCKVHDVRPFGGQRYHVTIDASYDSHAKWSQPSWTGPDELGIEKLDHREIPAPQEGFQILRFVGASCFERDQLGIFRIPQRGSVPPIAPGDPIILSNINGYSYAWNKGFNGVPPAKLRIV
jgi:diaminopimelate decarboxylase